MLFPNHQRNRRRSQRHPSNNRQRDRRRSGQPPRPHNRSSRLLPLRRKRIRHERNGNHGTVNGATLGLDRHGAAGKAYAFDGGNDYLEISDSPELSGMSEFSLSVWVRLSDSLSENGVIISKWSPSQDRMCYILSQPTMRFGS